MSSAIVRKKRSDTTYSTSNIGLVHFTLDRSLAISFPNSDNISRRKPTFSLKS